MISNNKVKDKKEPNNTVKASDFCQVLTNIKMFWNYKLMEFFSQVL